MNEMKLIHEVRKRELLYTVWHPDYKNLNKRLQAWNEVSRETGLTGQGAGLSASVVDCQRAPQLSVGVTVTARHNADGTVQTYVEDCRRKWSSLKLYYKHTLEVNEKWHFTSHLSFLLPFLYCNARKQNNQAENNSHIVQALLSRGASFNQGNEKQSTTNCTITAEAVTSKCTTQDEQENGGNKTVPSNSSTLNEFPSLKIQSVYSQGIRVESDVVIQELNDTVEIKYTNNDVAQLQTLNDLVDIENSTVPSEESKEENCVNGNECDPDVVAGDKDIRDIDLSESRNSGNENTVSCTVVAPENRIDNTTVHEDPRTCNLQTTVDSKQNVQNTAAQYTAVEDTDMTKGQNSGNENKVDNTKSHEDNCVLQSTVESNTRDMPLNLHDAGAKSLINVATSTSREENVPNTLNRVASADSNTVDRSSSTTDFGYDMQNTPSDLSVNEANSSWNKKDSKGFYTEEGLQNDQANVVSKFFLHLAEVVKTLPPFLQEMVKKKCFSVVRNAQRFSVQMSTDNEMDHSGTVSADNNGTQAPHSTTSVSEQVAPEHNRQLPDQVLQGGHQELQPPGFQQTGRKRSHQQSWEQAAGQQTSKQPASQQTFEQPIYRQRQAWEESAQQQACQLACQVPVRQQACQKPLSQQPYQQTLSQQSYQQPVYQLNSCQQSYQQPVSRQACQQPTSQQACQQPDCQQACQQPDCQRVCQQPACQQPTSQQACQQPTSQRAWQSPRSATTNLQQVTQLQTLQQRPCLPTSQQPPRQLASQPAQPQAQQQQPPHQQTRHVLRQSLLRPPLTHSLYSQYQQNIERFIQDYM